MKNTLTTNSQPHPVALANAASTDHGTGLLCLDLTHTGRITHMTNDDKFIEPFDGAMVQEQLDAAEQLVTNEDDDFFITGGAGTGKSYLVRALRSIIPISVCSTTAMSAINVGGVTVDRMFNFSREDWKVRSRPKLDEIMRSTAPNLLIDEASMIGASMAEPIYSAARRYRKRLILIGDMAQASPVKDTWATSHRLFADCKRIKLMHCHRQADRIYLDALNKIRMGVVDESVRETFRSCIDTSRDGTNTPDDYVRLFASNSLADDYNGKRFNKLPQSTPAVKLVGKAIDARADQRYELSSIEVKRAFDGARIADDEWMMIGARILIGVNDPAQEYVNGDSGIVTEITLTTKKVCSTMKDDQLPCNQVLFITVLLDRTGEEVNIFRITRDIKGAKGEPYFTLSGFPIRLGWAHTIHKAQGSTLRHAYVSLGSIVQAFKAESRHGVGYVALSRTTSLDGLRIDGWNDDAIFSSPEVKDFL